MSLSPKWRSSPSIPPTRTPLTRCTHWESEPMADTAATEMLHSLVPLCVTLGITADTASPDEVVLSLDWAPNLCTGNDVLHGGIVMALADSSGAVCAFLNLPEGAGGTATIESKTNFFAATRSGTVKAHSHPLHIGKRVIVVETEIRGDDGKLAAKTIQSKAVLRSALQPAGETLGEFPHPV